MFQGTASSVGKSILAAAFCRIFKDEGYYTAPFKSQNMALNSFVTKDGKEMGRAQVVQAEAARIEPAVEMNPILLKPTSDVGSQVIVNGQVFKNMTAKDYFKSKPKFKNIILESYNRLDSNFDVIVLEGAGSPAEINLRENDIVNMGMAEMVNSPVILIGDIDKGGVFASIYGTIMLLEEKERERIKGFIINKFRGDVDILRPGIKMIEEKINKPCLGVIPYTDVQIDDEDSVTTRFDRDNSGEINIGVIKLPYMSNFTDFTPLEMEEDVRVKYISHPEELESFDLIIIPGSKNTIKDMEFIINSNIDKAIYRNHRDGVPIIGICGGYQMLGHEIIDPDCVESYSARINGLSLLDIKTTMLKDKKTIQTKGRFIAEVDFFNSGGEDFIHGYEIHMGETQILEDARYAIELDEGRMDGVVNKDGSVFGSYLHGIFDNDGFRKNIIKRIREKKGLEIKDSNLSYKDLKEREYDKLAKIVKENIDLNKIKEIMGL
ncbi:MAG: cobyric acid synthase [Firmicutes bacterium]|nr:cobyric acid synthase [Bacillota bacterium]